MFLYFPGEKRYSDVPQWHLGISDPQSRDHQTWADGHIFEDVPSNLLSGSTADGENDCAIIYHHDPENPLNYFAWNYTDCSETAGTICKIDRGN